MSKKVEERDYSIEQQLKEYEDTFSSELTDDKVREVENFAKGVPRTFAHDKSQEMKKKEEDLIRSIMTNKKKEEENNKGGTSS